MGLGVDEIAAEFSRRYKLRPREAYRIARGLTRQEAVDSFNGHAVSSGPRTEVRLTVEDLRGYEGEAGDRSLPSLGTLTLLAEVYATDVRNLIDFNDRLLLPPGERLLIDREVRDDSQPGPSISALLIGQAAAVLAVAVAIVYAAGALFLGFKLWFIQDTWGPVLGGLPRDLILVSAISDVIPALIAAIPVYLLYYRSHPKKETHYWTFWRLLVMFVSAAVLALTTGLFLFFTRNYFYAKVLRPWWEIVLTCFVINIIVIPLALYFLWLVDTSSLSQQLRRFLGVGIVALALIPCVASVYATFPLPKVVLCGPAFYYADADGRHYMIGNLIGSSGQWVYVAETRTSKSKVAFGHYISVVPLSAVKLETIGASAECHNLVAVHTGA